MPLDHDDWAQIQSVIAREKDKVGQSFVQGKVIKRDEKRKLVWIKELGDQPIPIIAFEMEVKYYDTNGSGTVVKKVAKAKPLVPKIGQKVVVALHLNSRALPKCLGIIHSRDYVLGD